MIKNIKAIVLCGGKSSRMGENKALLNINGISLAEYQKNKLESLFFDVHLVCKDSSVFPFVANFLIESGDIYSPLIGLQSALSRLDSDFVFVLSVDTPSISVETIKSLCTKADSAFKAIILQNDRIHPLIGIYHKNSLPFIEKAIESKNYKIQNILDSMKVKYVKTTENIANLNTKEDYFSFLRS